MTSRQQQLLKTIIQQYIKTAEPIGSETLAGKFDFSSATIRNEMAELTEKGFLAQPHISAGRVPTEKAYHYYIANFLEEREPKSKVKQSFKNIRAKKLDEAAVREISKKIAELAGQLVILAIDRDSFYYTGLSYLFVQPEFNQPDVVYDISQVIDHLDKVVGRLFDEIGYKTEILLGKKNPFGEFYSTILTRLQLPWQKNYSLFGLLGPIRMDYNDNLSMVNYIKELLTK